MNSLAPFNFWLVLEMQTDIYRTSYASDMPFAYLLIGLCLYKTYKLTDRKKTLSRLFPGKGLDFQILILVRQLLTWNSLTTGIPKQPDNFMSNIILASKRPI